MDKKILKIYLNIYIISIGLFVLMINLLVILLI